MKRDDYYIAMPLVKKLEALIVNRDELETAITDTNKKDLPVSVCYADGKGTTTTIQPDNVSTIFIIQNLIDIIQLEIDDVVVLIENI